MSRLGDECEGEEVDVDEFDVLEDVRAVRESARFRVTVTRETYDVIIHH